MQDVNFELQAAAEAICPRHASATGKGRAA
jgi:hypothetical protein